MAVPRLVAVQEAGNGGPPRSSGPRSALDCLCPVPPSFAFIPLCFALAGPAKCTWFPGTTEKSPHLHYRPEKPKIGETILDFVGYTPCVRINKLTKEMGIEAEVVAKCEFFSAGGSVKDRIGKRMIEDAEKSGRIKPGDTIIEPTSGNTGE